MTPLDTADTARLFSQQITTLRRILEDLLADGTFNHRPITAGRVRDALEATRDVP